MSKRVTLTDREIWHIVGALKDVQARTTLDYQIVEAGKQALQDIIDKLQPIDRPIEVKEPTDV